MKNSIFITVILAILTTGVVAQDFHGKVKYNVTHNWVKKITAVDYLSQAEKDEYNYVWGNRAEYTLKAVMYFTNKVSRFEDFKDENSDEYGGYTWRSDEYFIFRNIEQNTSYDYIRFLDKLYVIEDSIRNQNWKILNDMREIAGHICMNASWNDTVKGNKVIAWYALDLPVPFGPERYGGLPGMILEIDVNNGAMIITAQEIQMADGDSVIEKPVHKKKVKKINEATYIEMLVNHIEQCKKDEFPYFWGTRY
jgi:GLPGLI family protein